MNKAISRTMCVLGMVAAMGGPAAAGSILVSSTGTDSGSCGASPPCATIGQAVTNAAAGDSILIGPGSYAGASVGKALTLSSSGGQGGAVITGTMTLAADGIVFGKPGKGFSLNPGSGLDAIVVAANGVTVRGNWISNCGTGVNSSGADSVVRDNSVNACSTGVQIAGATAQVRGNRMGYITSSGVVLDPASSDAEVRDNRTFGPSGVGFVIGGSGHVLRGNLVHGTPGGGFASTGTPSNVTLTGNTVVASSSPAFNLSGGSGWVLSKNAALNNNAPGFYLTANSTFSLIGNVAIGNVYGILITNGGGHVLKDNTAIDNQYGIILSGISSDVTISGGNLYGNTSNCAVSDSSSSAVTVDKVYWGGAGGPGADPADDICANTAATTVTNPAAKPAPIKLPSVK